MGVGQKIKLLRKKAGIQQKELAAMVGQTPTSIMHYEKEDRTPSYEVIEKIATALKVSPAVLMDWDSWENNLSEEVRTLEMVQNYFGKDAVELLNYYSNLNADGRKKALENIADLTELTKYKK